MNIVAAWHISNPRICLLLDLEYRLNAEVEAEGWAQFKYDGQVSYEIMSSEYFGEIIKDYQLVDKENWERLVGKEINYG